MALEKDFAAFEEAIIRVGREYDVFLYGTGGRMPADGRRRLQEMARRLSATRVDSPADRYRMNTVLGRYTSQSELWDRAVRDKEEGRGRFSRPSAASAVNASAPASVHSVAEGSPDSAGIAERNAAGLAARDAAGLAAGDDALFARFREARRERGDDVSRLSLEKFREQLAREREKLAERTGHAQWEFDLAEDGERVRLIARQGKGNRA